MNGCMNWIGVKNNEIQIVMISICLSFLCIKTNMNNMYIVFKGIL